MSRLLFDPTYVDLSITDIDKETGRTLTACTLCYSWNFFLQSGNHSAAAGAHVWRTALATPAMTSGVHRWEVIIDRCSGNGNVMIGVTENTQMLTGNYIGQAVGIAYYGASGYGYWYLLALPSTLI